MKNSIFISAVMGLLLIVSINPAKASCHYEKHIKVENLKIGNLVSWATSREINSASFVIERSTNGFDFEEIGKEKAAHFSNSIKEYSFIDFNTETERAFYRLKQIDEDGSFTYSDVTIIKNKNKNNFTVYEMSAVNVHKNFEFDLKSKIKGQMTYKLVNGRGKTVYSSQRAIHVGDNQIGIRFDDYPLGVYKIILSMKGEKDTLVVNKTKK